jgi:hypothetical protein
MSDTQSKGCKFCGGPIQWRQTSAGRWIPFEGPDKPHYCKTLSNQARQTNQDSKENVFSDVTFPKEFVLKTEAGESPKPAPAARAKSPRKPNVKRSTRSRTPKTPVKPRQDNGELTPGRIISLGVIILVIFLSLWSRWVEQ